MQCKRCLNTDTSFFYIRNKQWYCRKCIALGRMEKHIPTVYPKDNEIQYRLSYCLTKEQETVANVLLERYQKGRNTKLKAVCGAGKTEILYPVMQYALQQGHRVCLAIPRRELVKELAQRITSQFEKVSCSVVYGGHTKETIGQLVICTCHQLFRYPQAFDLLIVDEEDAFPYQHNEILQNIALQSNKGHYICMSATLATNVATLSLATRYHGYALPLPVYRKASLGIAMLLVIKKLFQYRREHLPVLLYVPQIKQTYQVKRILDFMGIRSKIAHSQCSDIQTTIVELKKGRIDVIVTTTILERGITIANVQVIVIQGEHKVYDSATLLQICGRVGRKETYPTGDITIYAVYQTKAMKVCKQTLLADNASVV